MPEKYHEPDKTPVIDELIFRALFWVTAVAAIGSIVAVSVRASFSL